MGDSVGSPVGREVGGPVGGADGGSVDGPGGGEEGGARCRYVGTTKWAFIKQRHISRHVSDRTSSACSMVGGVWSLCCMPVGWEHGVQDRGCLRVLSNSNGSLCSIVCGV